VDPDQVLGLYERAHRLGEALVHPLVAAREAAVIFGEVDAVVEERPQGSVGVAVIIFLDVLFLEVDRGGGDALVALEVDLAGELLGLVPGPAEPDAAILPERGGERDRKPALRALRIVRARGETRFEMTIRRLIGCCSTAGKGGRRS
jgi:hypothetical protein